MLKSPVLWAALGLLLGIALGGSYMWGLLLPAYDSSHVSHSNHKKDDARGDNPCADKGGTPECPLFVQRAPSAAEQRKAAEDAQAEHEKTRREWHLAVATWGIVLVTLCLAVGTVFVASYTFNLWEATKTIASDANAATRRLITMEAPYVSGGGDFESVGGRWLFRLDVENHGKTPAFMTGYDLQFTTLAEVKKELKEVKENFRHMDGISAHGKRKEIRTQRERCYGADIVYGAIYYKDVFEDRYCSRFLLRVAPWHDIPKEGLTRLDVDAGVSSKYWSWDRPKDKEAKNTGLS